MTAETEHLPRCFVISITPFRSDGGFDEDGFRRHLGRMADAGIGVYVGGGGSGEGYTLEESEVARVLQIAVEELKGRVPVRAMGVEPRTAAQMVRFVAGAEAAGVDAVQVYSLDVGHAHQPTPGELEDYFGEVLSSTDAPCVLSTHQSVGYAVPAPLIASLADRYPHLIGVNCSHQDLGYLASVIDAVASRAPVHVGGPMQALTAFALGAHGFLSSEANLAPRLAASVGQARDAGDIERMMASFGALLRLSGLLYGHGGIRATKAALGLLGLPGGVPRPPRRPVDAATEDAVRRGVRDLGILQGEGLEA